MPTDTQFYGSKIKRPVLECFSRIINTVTISWHHIVDLSFPNVWDKTAKLIPAFRTANANIAANADAIAGNDTDIAANAAAIASNDTDIAALQTDVAANTTSIAGNTTLINNVADTLAADWDTFVVAGL